MEESSVQIFVLCEKSYSLAIWEEGRLVGTTSSTSNFGSSWTARWNEIADFQSIFTHSASAVASSKKVQLSRNSTTRFPMSPTWTSYLAPKPPKGAQKRKTSVFHLKPHFTWRKFATKFLCVKTVSDKVVRHWLAYLCMRKWFGGDVPFYVKIGDLE